jgi:hypothetical protein
MPIVFNAEMRGAINVLTSDVDLPGNSKVVVNE